MCAAVLDPAEFRTVSVTVYVPGFAYLCVGFWSVEDAESPKLHDQDVGEPVDVSVNASVSVFPPYAAVNEATGATTVVDAFTVIVFVVEALPAEFVAVSRIV